MTTIHNFISPRFQIRQIIGEGSFSILYEAIDYKYQCYVALKVEKEKKSKQILKTEYKILTQLQDLPHIPKVYDFIENYPSVEKLNGLNFIEMEQKNYSSIETKKCKYTVSDDVRVEKYVVDCVLRDEDGIGALVILEPIVETRNSHGRRILEFTGAEDMVPPVKGTKVSVVVESESNGETEWVSQYIFHDSIMCRFQND
jgi:serine/threonine protein kinase